MLQTVHSGRQQQEQLSIPNGIAYELVFRREAGASDQATDRPPGFFVWRSVLDVLANFHRLAICAGWRCALRAPGRMAKGRLFYGIMDAGVIVTWGWITLGHCRHYWVESAAAVFGPMATLPDYRRRGHATRALLAAIAEMTARGYGVFYIDTSGGNVAARRVIEKCGFGQPVASFLRGIPGHLQSL
jgi:GNAT superfamily N-acetyltransferase